MSATTRGPRGNAARTGTSLLVVLALAGCGTQVAGQGGAEPPQLRIGAANAAGAAADTAVKGAPSNGATITLDGTLPDGPANAEVRRFGDSRIALDRVRELAVALGIGADPVRRAHGWEAIADGAVLRVHDGSGEWSYSRAGLECPVFLVDVEEPTTDGSVSSCAAVDVVASPTPTPAVPAPTDSVAASLAAPVLAAIATAGEMHVLAPAGGLTRTVVADAVVAGLPTSGMRTILDVDRLGVADGSGHLGESSAGDRYPLVSARSAYDRLSSMPRPMPAIGCLEAKNQPTVCPQASPLVVTGATLGLMIADDAGEQILVPTWLFEVRGSDEPLTSVAVAARFLSDPEPVSTPDASTEPAPGSPSEPASGSPSEPAPDAPSTSPAGPGYDSTAITSARLSSDGRTITLVGWGGMCATYSGAAVETPSEVTLGIHGVSTIGPDEGCIDMAQEIHVSVSLDTVLGTRAVHTMSGDPITVAGA
jgi:hypothetical protein